MCQRSAIGSVVYGDVERASVCAIRRIRSDCDGAADPERSSEIAGIDQVYRCRAVIGGSASKFHRSDWGASRWEIDGHDLIFISAGYASAAGYDANVKAIRLLPNDTMAANSSFTIRFG